MKMTLMATMMRDDGYNEDDGDNDGNDDETTDLVSLCRFYLALSSCSN